MIVTLNNGVKMDQLGFGVWQLASGEETVKAVKTAIEIGYRSIDTAMIYQNEESVGQAIRESGVPRDQLFITTKVWNSDQGYENTLKAFDASMERLGLDYLDLYLVHWPMPKENKYIETYRALEKLYKDGRVRAIGVANFNVEHLEHLLAECEVVPVVNQLECHPYFAQLEVKEFCAKHNIFVEAHTPLRKGKEIFEDEVIKEVAQKYGKTPAQVVLRWHLQKNVIVIPKSANPPRMKENFETLNFELSAEDIAKIDGLNTGNRIGRDPNDMYVLKL